VETKSALIGLEAPMSGVPMISNGSQRKLVRIAKPCHNDEHREILRSRTGLLVDVNRPKTRPTRLI
jgi:hypothetical protein